MPRTARLIMRPWRFADLEPFAEMNADPEVMEFFPAALSREESDALATRFAAAFDAQGWGLWALEVADGPDAGRFAGYTGLSIPGWGPSFGPCVEVGWRLSRWAWGRGYATEAATAALGIGFGDLGLEEIVSFTAAGNARSRAVMTRLGMIHDPADDFDHPLVPAETGLRRHVLYRLRPQAADRH